MELQHAWEAFYRAVDGAASSEKPLQQRLADAYVYSIRNLEGVHVPVQIWERIEKLGKTLTAKAAVGGEATIRATTSAMTTEEARELLHEIVSIFTEIAEAHNGSRPG